MQMVWQLLDNVLSNCSIIGQFCVHQLESVVSNSPMVGLCCVQLSDGLWSDCPTVQWSDCALAICPMVGQSCVQLSESWKMLCQTVRWFDSALSNSTLVSQCWVKLSNDWQARRSTIICRLTRYFNSKIVLKEVYIVLKCLVGCIQIFLIIYLLYQNIINFCAFGQTVWDSKSYYIGHFLYPWSVAPSYSNI